MKSVLICVLSAALAFGFMACGASDSFMSSDSAKESGNGGGGGSPGEWWDAGASASADYGPPPEGEDELDFDLKAPQASEHYVYIAATARDALVRISADDSLEIRLIPVGGQPTVVATLGSKDVALVINSGTQDFSIVRSTEETDTVKTVDTLPYVNSIAVSPDGNYAIVYYNDAVAGEFDPVGDFQTISVVDVREGQEAVYNVSTGFHPGRIYFHESDPIAYLITDDGISVLDLDAVKDGMITPIVAVADGNMDDDPALREVLVTENGSYAVVYNRANPEFSVVDIDSGEIVTEQVDGLPTDVDLIPSANSALLMLREQKLAYVVGLHGMLAGEADALTKIDIEGSQAGAAVVTADGSRAVLYSTVGNAKAVAVMDLNDAGFAWEAYAAQKSVVGVSVSQHGSTALVLHEVEAYSAEASGLDKMIAQTNGFTLFNLDTGYRKLIQTENHWTQSLFVSEDPAADLRAFVLTPSASGIGHTVQSADLDTYIVEDVSLASEPMAMVYVPLARRVAVAQDHPNGRITFIDVDTGKTYSVTGYELNGLIH
jgi:hypothetical protein